MAAPLRIDELTATGSLTATAAVAVVQGGQTLQFPASAFITQANSITQSGTGAVVRTVQARLRDSVCVLDYIPVTEHAAIAAGTSTTDVTTYIQAAIDAVETGTGGPKSIYFPAGFYKITGTLTMTRGTVLWGEGTTGTNEAYGTHISHAVNNGIALEWNGNDATTAVGTGGGLYSINVSKANGFTGGDAIKLTATDDNHRPGEMTFDNVLCYGEGTATWARGLHVDGTACTTAGSKGVRTIHFRKFRVADTTQSGQSIYFNQCVHMFGDVEIDTGDGANVGITIAGDSTHYYLTMRNSGSLTINDSTTDETAYCDLRGYVGTTFDNNNEDLVGQASFIAGTAITNASKTLKIVSDKTDAFYVKVDTTISNVTGDGTAYTVIFETEQYDKNSSYDATTGIFTAKCAGLYEFTWMVTMGGLTSAETRHDSGLIHKNSGGTVQNAIDVVTNPYGGSASGNYATQGAAQLDLSEGDTVEVKIDVANGTKVVDVIGASGTRYTYFSGKLLS